MRWWALVVCLLAGGARGARKGLDDIWAEVAEGAEPGDGGGWEAALERVKQAVLEGLGLDAPPPSPQPSLRRPFHPPLPPPAPLPETNRQNIQLLNKEWRCEEDEEEGGVRLEATFEVPALLEAAGLVTASFVARPPEPASCRLSLHSCQTDRPQIDSTFNRTLSSNQLLNGGWVEADVKGSLKGRLELRQLCLKAALACRPPVAAPLACPPEEGPKPFLSITADVSVKGGRWKRGSDCEAGSEAGERECCRESAVVSFRSIGWDWIVSPERIDAHHCAGRCTRASFFTKTTYGAIVERMISKGMASNLASKRTCCVPKSYSSLSLIYQVNNSVFSAITPNIVVESCQCIS